MRLTAIVVALTLLPLVSAAAGIDGYKGADGGRVLLSTSIAPAGLWFTVKYRQVEGKGKGEAFGDPWNMFRRADFAVDPPSFTPPDLEAKGEVFAPGRLLGTIESQRLPPGRYEVYAVVLEEYRYRSSGKVELRTSIPFEVRPGRTTYLGAFEAYPVTYRGSNALGRFLEAMDHRGYSVFLRDMSRRDVAIARGKLKDVGEVDVHVQTLSVFDRPGFDVEPLKPQE